MTEWARMTPDERGRARLQFQEARQISPQESARRAGTRTWRCRPKSGARWPTVPRPCPRPAAPTARACGDAGLGPEEQHRGTPFGQRCRQDRGAHGGAGQARRQHHIDFQDRHAARACAGRPAEDRRRPGQGRPQHAAAAGRPARRRRLPRRPNDRPRSWRAGPGARPAPSSGRLRLRRRAAVRRADDRRAGSTAWPRSSAMRWSASTGCSCSCSWCWACTSAGSGRMAGRRWP